MEERLSVKSQFLRQGNPHAKLLLPIDRLSSVGPGASVDLGLMFQVRDPLIRHLYRLYDALGWDRVRMKEYLTERNIRGSFDDTLDDLEWLHEQIGPIADPVPLDDDAFELLGEKARALREGRPEDHLLLPVTRLPKIERESAEILEMYSNIRTIGDFHGWFVNISSRNKVVAIGLISQLGIRQAYCVEAVNAIDDLDERLGRP